jgi:hypothetical protein
MSGVSWWVVVRRKKRRKESVLEEETVGEGWRTEEERASVSEDRGERGDGRLGRGEVCVPN